MRIVPYVDVFLMYLWEVCSTSFYSAILPKSLISFFLLNFFFFWLHWVFVAARGLSLVVASGGYSLLQSAGFSLRWLLLLQSTGSRCAGFSSCGVQASVVVACGL